MAAAPVVVGVIALAKELDPMLDVRLAQHALATTSRVVDANDSSGTGVWQRNAAGLNFNSNYGFGLIDATAFVNKVEQAAFVTAPQTYTTGTLTVPLANRTVTTAGQTQSVVIGAAQFTAAGVNRLPLESVEIALDVTSTDRTGLQGILTSPAGTSSVFLNASNQLTGQQPGRDDPTPAAGLRWTFLANNFWGEDPLGNWLLNLTQRDNRTSTWNSFALTFHLGQMVLESGNLTISAATSAHSVQIDAASTLMTITPGTTFSVRDEVWSEQRPARCRRPPAKHDRHRPRPFAGTAQRRPAHRHRHDCDEPRCLELSRHGPARHGRRDRHAHHRG